MVETINVVKKYKIYFLNNTLNRLDFLSNGP